MIKNIRYIMSANFSFKRYKKMLTYFDNCDRKSYIPPSDLRILIFIYLLWEWNAQTTDDTCNERRTQGVKRIVHWLYQLVIGKGIKI